MYWGESYLGVLTEVGESREDILGHGKRGDPRGPVRPGTQGRAMAGGRSPAARGPRKAGWVRLPGHQVLPRRLELDCRASRA